MAAVFGDQLIQRGREKELLARGEEYEKQMGLPKGEGWKDVQLQWTSNRFDPEDRIIFSNSKINWDEEKVFVGTKDQFENAQSATDAALVWVLSFERCIEEEGSYPEGEHTVYKNLQGLESRIKEAEKAYDDFANNY